MMIFWCLCGMRLLILLWYEAGSSVITAFRGVHFLRQWHHESWLLWYNLLVNLLVCRFPCTSRLACSSLQVLGALGTLLEFHLFPLLSYSTYMWRLQISHCITILVQHYISGSPLRFRNSCLTRLAFVLYRTMFRYTVSIPLIYSWRYKTISIVILF